MYGIALAEPTFSSDRRAMVANSMQTNANANAPRDPGRNPRQNVGKYFSTTTPRSLF
jgi:hypothetical protein